MSRKANAELLKEFQKNPSGKTYEAVAGGLELPANIGAPKVLTPEGKENSLDHPIVIVKLRGEKYKDELVRDMKLMGCTKISDLNRNNLRFRRQ